jgi:glucose-6-phosphate dehydrogenase assembly protein OpcA
MEANLVPLHLDSVTDIRAILEELSKSRQSGTPADSAPGALIVTMNFVVFVDDPAHRSWVLERAERVARKHPSRLIVLDSTPATSGVEVSTATSDNGGSTIVNERVDIGVGTLDHGSIISLVQELSVPDIETVLWWSGARLLQSRTFSGIATGAGTVLVDSSGKVRGEETIRELGEFLSRFPNVALHDLAFMRLAPWQEMIAQFFDNPALREDLFSIDSLTIESGSDAEALYLAGWLASRLSWESCGRDEFCDRRGLKIPFAKMDKGDQRRVLSVVVTANDSIYRAALSETDDKVVAVSVAGAKAGPVRYVPLQNIENTSLIERAILQKSRDDIFEVSLLTVRELLG